MISTNLQVFHDVISKISRKTGEKLKKIDESSALKSRDLYLSLIINIYFCGPLAVAP